MGGGSRVHLVHRWSVDGEPEFGWVRSGHSASRAVVEAVGAHGTGRRPLASAPPAGSKVAAVSGGAPAHRARRIRRLTRGTTAATAIIVRLTTDAYLSTSRTRSTAR